MTTRNVAVLVGSLRKQSFNRKIANEMIALAPASLNLEIVENRPALILQSGSGGDAPGGLG